MKLVLGSIFFCSLIAISSTGFAQTTWENTNGGAFETPGNWSSGAPTLTTGAIIAPVSGSTLSITESSIYSIPSLAIQGGGTVALNIAGIDNLTISGANPSQSSKDI